MEMPFLWFAFIHVLILAFIIGGYALRYVMPWSIFWFVGAAVLIFVIYMPLDTIIMENLVTASVFNATNSSYSYTQDTYDISFTGPNFQSKVMLIFMAGMLIVGGAMVEAKSKR